MEDKKETAPELILQEQKAININKLRVENGLAPISNGNSDFISKEQFDNL